jgi:hypothetical protein
LLCNLHSIDTHTILFVVGLGDDMHHDGVIGVRMRRLDIDVDEVWKTSSIL